MNWVHRCPKSHAFNGKEENKKWGIYVRAAVKFIAYTYSWSDFGVLSSSIS